MIRRILAEMQNGLDERVTTENHQQRTYMRAVGTQDGRLLGYSERLVHEMPTPAAA